MRFGIIIGIMVMISTLSGQGILKQRSALNFAQNGEYDKAINIYSNLLKENPDDSRLLYNLGTVYLLKKDFDKSIETLQKASATEDDELREDVYYNLGNAYYQKKEFADALGAYKKALKINHKNKKARENLELSLREQKEQEQKQNSDKNKNMEASDYAKKLKKMAEEMAKKRNYSGAFNLMMAGLKKDKTVQVYKDFIGRLKTVAEIQGA